MAVLIPVAGGKGGVGKSIVSLNISAALAAQCKRVILCDLDLGGSNLHTMLGLKNNQSGFGHFIHKMETQMTSLLQATGISNLQFIAGDCLLPGASNLDFFTKQKIIKELKKLDADYIILDLGAGTSHNTIDFFLTAADGIIVTTPELTSVLNAYSFLKSLVFRFCYRLFPAKSPQRTILNNSVLQRLEGKDYSFETILKVIDTQFPGSGKKVLDELQKLQPRVIMNMTRSTDEIEMGMRLRNLARSKLSIDLSFTGYLPYDDHVTASIARRQPVFTLFPQTPITAAVQTAAARILSKPAVQDDIFLHDVQEDIAEIVKDYYTRASE